MPSRAVCAYKVLQDQLTQIAPKVLKISNLERKVIFADTVYLRELLSAGNKDTQIPIKKQFWKGTAPSPKLLVILANIDFSPKEIFIEQSN